MTLRQLYNQLSETNSTLIVDSLSNVNYYNRQGVADLYDLYTKNPKILRHSNVADKVIGTGAAALMVLGGIEACYAGVISFGAREILRAADIVFGYEHAVPRIINRQGNGQCPLEVLIGDRRDPKEILPIITRFMEENASQK